MNLTLQFINKKNINRSKWNIKNKKLKIMAATNWTIIRREKASNEIVTFDLVAKWTYKTALGIAIESNNNEIYDLVCVIETNKIITKK